MSKAEKMFNKLGYKKNTDKNKISYWKHWGEYEEYSGYEEWASFSFDLDNKTFSADETYEPKCITVEEHIAVIEQTRELGWLDDKEIPMKPNINGRYCGNCGSVRFVPQNNYCSNCGQKIDWSEFDD